MICRLRGPGRLGPFRGASGVVSYVDALGGVELVSGGCVEIKTTCRSCFLVPQLSADQFLRRVSTFPNPDSLAGCRLTSRRES